MLYNNIWNEFGAKDEKMRGMVACGSRYECG